MSDWVRGKGEGEKTDLSGTLTTVLRRRCLGGRSLCRSSLCGCSLNKYYQHCSTPSSIFNVRRTLAGAAFAGAALAGAAAALAGCAAAPLPVAAAAFPFPAAAAAPLPAVAAAAAPLPFPAAGAAPLPAVAAAVYVGEK
jgi:hypothetical protein